MTDETVHSAEAIPALLDSAGLSGWYFEVPAICRRYSTDGWPTTLMLVNTVGYLCEQAWHHADLHASYGELAVRLSTHSAGGVTDKDIELACRIEQIVLWRPGADSALDGTPNAFVSGV